MPRTFLICRSAPAASSEPDVPSSRLVIGRRSLLSTVIDSGSDCSQPFPFPSVVFLISFHILSAVLISHGGVILGRRIAEEGFAARNTAKIEHVVKESHRASAQLGSWVKGCLQMEPRHRTPAHELERGLQSALQPPQPPKQLPTPQASLQPVKPPKQPPACQVLQVDNAFVPIHATCPRKHRYARAY